MSRVFNDRVIIKGELFVNESSTFQKDLIVGGTLIVNNFEINGNLKLDGTNIKSTADEINYLSGTTFA